jgi:hypothetical protein
MFYLEMAKIQPWANDQRVMTQIRGDNRRRTLTAGEYIVLCGSVVVDDKHAERDQSNI